jgi:hypothetical protein
MIYSLKTKRKVHPRYAALNEDERGVSEAEDPEGTKGLLDIIHVWPLCIENADNINLRIANPKE